MSRPDVSTVAEMFSGLYEVLESMPWNGLAPTYKAKRGDEIVVLALLPVDAEDSPAASDLFHARARALIGLDHPRLLPVMAEGVRFGVPYLELAYVEGETLDHLVARGPIERQRALTIARRVLQALELLEAVDILHLDVTPSNVLVAGVDEVRLMGTGVAAILREVRDTDKTGPTGKGSGPSAGRFLAPELLVGDKVDRRSDIYGVGALMHYMLTGQPMGKEAAPPPDDLLKIISRATARRREDRYARAAAMRAAIEATGAPVTLLPPPLEPQPPGEPAYEVPARRPTAGSLPAAAMTVDAASKPHRSRGLLLAAMGIVLLGALGTAFVISGSSRPDEETSSPAPTGGPSGGAPASATESPGARADDTVSQAQTRAAPDDAPGVEPPTIEEAAPEGSDVAGDVTSAEDDLLAGTLPSPLDALQARIAAGEELSRGEQHLALRFAAEHRDDARPHLLLARDFMARGWSSDTISEYLEAFGADPRCSADARMRADLIELAKRAASGPAAARAVVRIFGDGAVPTVEEELEEDLPAGERRRLVQLQRRLAALTGD